VPHRDSNRSRWLVALSVLHSHPATREGRSVAVGVIFAGSYLALAIVRIPGLSIDRSRQLCAVSRTPVWKPTVPSCLRVLRRSAPAAVAQRLEGTSRTLSTDHILQECETDRRRRRTGVAAPRVETIIDWGAARTIETPG
jgi:hypothetical protein